MLQIFLQLLETESEREDFTKLYESYRTLMHWVARGILQDEQLAEDAVQDAFLRIIKNFHKINEIICPETKSYVVIIVRNVALTMRERETRRAAEQVRWHEGEAEGQEMVGDALHDALQNLSSGFDETADEVSRREIIEQVLALPDTLKEVLLLYGYFGYSISSIGTSLGISEAAAYKRLQRARDALAQKLDRK